MPLRLKSLELHGYKTFAAKTAFEFAEGITAIVGPNGSGKSNIADALRWVLGEQSYSLLRAKKTEDMIFAGSEHRPRAGMASAMILFDNTENWLPVDFSEVALARRAYRDGNNEYRLNGQKVRLRDVNELLAQSGLGQRTYTILGQGLVDASLALKADDRRRLFEEAAGIGLYRSRREEALRRLEKTQRNLERVLDIMAELSPLLRRLERQARRAREYSQVQADLRILLRDWYGYHWHRAQKELAEGREALRRQSEKLREAQGAHHQQQGEFTAFRGRIQELRSRLSAWHRQSSELHSQRETVSRDLAVLEERRRSLQTSRQNILAEQERARDEERIAQERLAAAEKETSRLQAEYEEAQGQIESAQESLTGRQSERAQVEEQLQAARRQVGKLGAQRAELQARLDELGSRMESQQQKMEQTERAVAKAEEDARQAQKRQHAAKSKREKAGQAYQQAEAALSAQREKAAALDVERRKQLEKRAERETTRTRLQAQLEVLEQAEQSLSGYAEGARFLLEAARQSRLKKSHGALSAALDVPAEYETAIAAALGEYVDAILLDSADETEQALTLLENDQAGRAAILPLEKLSQAAPLKAPKDAACLGVAAELIQAPDALRPAVDLLLGRVLIVKDRAAARRLIKGKDAATRAVTLRGEVFRADGLILAGGQTRSGTLSRPRQRRELQQSLEDVSSRLAAFDKTLTRLTAELESARQEESRLEEALRRARARLDEAQAEEQQAALALESARRQVAWQTSQREQLQAEIERAETDRQQAAESLSKIDEQDTQSREALRTLSAQLAELSLDEAQSQVTYWSTRVAVTERAVSDARARQTERQQAVSRLAGQQEALQRRLKETEQSLAALETEKETLRKKEADLNAQLEALQTQIEPAEKELETAEAQEGKQRSQETTAQRALATIERQYGQMQLDVTRRQEALDTLRQRIEDDFGLVMFSYGADVSGPVPLPFDGMVEQLPVITELPPELEEQVTQQRARLRRMGPVNPEAQEEYDKEHQRFEFLETQVADLRKAEADLREVIDELDELTERAFYKTFKAVAQEFREIFVRLFGGGSAKLMLTDPDNLIETGIEIQARLPGRREQGLALLSGGERSLTAIALVFALLKVSPTPICVMDEVDAMLDEANVGRFREMLLDLSKDTQFIIITHNRNTVQAADVIYGVTMGRDSTSQVISLKLDEISEDMLR
ncbi:MAG: chromosome segregation protein SMC [Chloroflexi bacterium]|nr:chromosome segregation protein SMC [Chloroflexota bacterium]